MIDLETKPSVKYGNIQFFVPSTQTQRKILVRPLLRSEILKRKDIGQPVEMFPDSKINLVAISKMTLDEFVENFENYRNDLAQRKLKDQKLTISEKFELDFLNEKLDNLIGYKRPKEILEALDIIKEAKRIISFKK